MAKTHKALHAVARKNNLPMQLCSQNSTHHQRYNCFTNLSSPLEHFPTISRW